MKEPKIIAELMPQPAPNQEVQQEAASRYTDIAEPEKPQQKAFTPEEIDAVWRYAFLDCLFHVAPDFKVDSLNRDILHHVYTWMWARLGREQPGELDPRKGLLLYGPIGTGKTTLLRGMQQYMALIEKHSGYTITDAAFEMRSAAEMALYYSSEGMSALARWTEREGAHNLAIDEIGREELAKHYGTPCNVIQTVLQLRYEQRDLVYTLGSTNMDMEGPEFGERYGSYILDRVKELFNIIEMPGESRRNY